MHGMNDQVDIRRFGGLRTQMKITWATTGLGYLALIGIPPLSGFFSKDQVVAAASEAGRSGLWVLALVGSFLTAVYMTRATVMTFFGEPRHGRHPHDAPSRMRAALVLLAIGAAFGGALGLSATTGVLHEYLEPVFGRGTETHVGPAEWVLTIISVVVALAGIGLALFVYLSGKIDWIALRARFGGLKRLLQRGFYFDDVYGGGLVAPAKLGSAFLAYVFDKRVIDGTINALGRAVGALAGAGRRVQTGLVRNYALGILLGAVAVLFFLAARF
jgi:NADH-quinone oxidoreductase subunit L